MTTEEKFSDVESILGYPCEVLTCQHNVNGRATCGDYTEDHCIKKLHHEATNVKNKYVEYDKDGNKILVDNKCSLSEEKFIPLEPWVPGQTVIDLNYI
jgi:hypothetical protein